jgi:hypothetical protein
MFETESRPSCSCSGVALNSQPLQAPNFVGQFSCFPDRLFWKLLLIPQNQAFRGIYICWR